LAETTYKDVLSIGMCPKMRPVGVSKKGKKGQKLSCVKLAICPRRHRSLKFCVRGRVREVVIYFKFRENRSRGLRAVEGRKSPSPIDLAHGLYNSLYYCTSRDKNKIGTQVKTNKTLSTYAQESSICSYSLSSAIDLQPKRCALTMHSSNCV